MYICIYIYLYYVCISTLPGKQVALDHKHIVSELSIPNSMDTASMALSFARLVHAWEVLAAIL